jgi:hypothetical protein
MNDLYNKYYLDITEGPMYSPTYSGSMVVINTNKITDICLYRYRIPVELRSMIIGYLFEDECVFKAAYERILDVMQGTNGQIGERIDKIFSCHLGYWYTVTELIPGEPPVKYSEIVNVKLYKKLENRKVKPVKNTFIKYIIQQCVIGLEGLKM